MAPLLLNGVSGTDNRIGFANAFAISEFPSWPVLNMGAGRVLRLNPNPARLQTIMQVSVQKR